MNSEDEKRLDDHCNEVVTYQALVDGWRTVAFAKRAVCDGGNLKMALERINGADAETWSLGTGEGVVVRLLSELGELRRELMVFARPSVQWAIEVAENRRESDALTAKNCPLSTYENNGPVGEEEAL